MTHAAWSSVDITPALGSPIGGMGIPSVISTRTLDRLQAGVILLQDDHQRRAAIISIDCVGITPMWGLPLRTSIAALLGCPVSSVLLNASHTHSGGETIWDYYASSEPMPHSVIEYLARLSGKVLGAVQSALSRLAPAQINWHRGQTHIAINRRLKTPDGVMHHRPNPDGFVDRTLDLLHLTTPHGQALLLTAACHTVSVYGAHPDAFSGDFVTPARQSLAQSLGNNAHIQFAQGFAGDCRPHILADLSTLHFRPAKSGETQAIGLQLADEARAALAEKSSPVRLALSSDECFMPIHPGQPIPRQTMQNFVTGKPTSYAHLCAWWLAQLDAGVSTSQPIGWSLGALKLTPKHWIIHTAGEPVGQLAPIVRQTLPSALVAAWGYTQDYTAYLPTDAMLPEGGYEVCESNLFQRFWPAAPAHGIDQTLADHCKTLVKALQT
jgi:neutral ceramidase